MSLLLDSNALVWWLAEMRLPDQLLERIEYERPVYISLVTPWELWIKAAAGRLILPPSFEDGLTREDNLTILSPTIEDARVAADLPPIHRDPFDRMIVAQALGRQATVVTSDRVFADYGVDVILV